MVGRNTKPVLLGTIFVVALVLLWFSREVLLLLFAGILVALVLTSLINLIRKVVPLRQGFALGLVLLLFAGLLTGLGFIAADPVAQQFSALAERVPQALTNVRETVQGWSAYDTIEKALPDLGEGFSSGELGKFTGFFSSAFEAAGSLGFVIFTALFLAANPQLYHGMMLKLVPPKHRDDAHQVTEKSICTLKYWLLGQLVSMAAIGVLTGIALAIAGIPLALALGVLAGVAEFIPILGPLIAAVPVLLLAFTEGSDKFFIACGIMLGIQLLEGNVIMPLVQKKAIDLPPAVTLASVFVLGGAFGLVGMFIAAPLAAVILVLIDELYLRRYLKSPDRLLEDSDAK